MKRINRIIFLSLLLAVFLTVLPMPKWIASYRPEWVLLVLVYWMITLPEKVSIVTAWIAGLVVDVITGSLFGQHAMGFIIIGYMVIRNYQQLRMLSLIQHSVLLFILMMGYMLLMFFFYSLAGSPPKTAHYWGAAATSAIIWPWLFVTLRSISRDLRRY